jgi:predicted nucleic acid-binding Zn ribbon protein
MNERRAGSAATELWGLMRTAAFRLFARALEGFEASRGGRPTTLAAVRSEHLATFPDAGPREEGTAADTAPAPDVRRAVKRGGTFNTSMKRGLSCTTCKKECVSSNWHCTRRKPG